MIILLVGIAASMVVISIVSPPHDQVCTIIPDYSEKAYTDSHIYDSDPQKQLYVFRQELGDAWVSGHYDEKEDLLKVCAIKET